MKCDHKNVDKCNKVVKYNKVFKADFCDHCCEKCVHATGDLKFKRDLAEVTYKTTRDMLNAMQAEMSGLQTLYKRQEEI